MGHILLEKFHKFLNILKEIKISNIILLIKFSSKGKVFDRRSSKLTRSVVRRFLTIKYFKMIHTILYSRDTPLCVDWRNTKRKIKKSWSCWSTDSKYYPTFLEISTSHGGPSSYIWEKYCCNTRITENNSEKNQENTQNCTHIIY